MEKMKTAFKFVREKQQSGECLKAAIKRKSALLRMLPRKLLVLLLMIQQPRCVSTHSFCLSFPLFLPVFRRICIVLRVIHVTSCKVHLSIVARLRSTHVPVDFRFTEALQLFVDFLPPRHGYFPMCRPFDELFCQVRSGLSCFMGSY